MRWLQSGSVRRLLLLVIPGSVAAGATWAAFADDKSGFTVVSAAIAALLGAFAHPVWQAVRRSSDEEPLSRAADRLAIHMLTVIGPAL
ncbi:hypothetical protein AB0J82_15455 [Asanoa sp. NPDC049518]|uniref:hypothetical protein n=1 Tax=unclassified Asanoa TaxID=2685164 RepID=UPI00343993CA